MRESSKAKRIKAGLLLTTLAAAAGAVTAAILLQRKREEEVYHEAELKAMDELEAFMRDEETEECDCAEECASVELMQEETEPIVEEEPMQVDAEDEASEAADATQDEASEVE